MEYSEFEKALDDLDRTTAIGYIVTYLMEISERDKTLEAAVHLINNIFLDKFEK
jgi:hypothetical protein